MKSSEELETTLSYHRIASERLLTTERKLEDSEREKSILQRRLSHLSTAYEKAEKEATTSSYKFKEKMTRNRNDGFSFEDGKKAEIILMNSLV